MFNVNLIEKTISYIMLQIKLKKAINKYLKNQNYDIVLYTAPPITINNVIKYCKKKYNSFAYLMQKDIFPQNAIDIEILNKKNPAYWYFKYKEKQIYKISDKIGCMSQGNINYLLEHNKFLKSDKLEIFPNTIKIAKIENNKNYNFIRNKYGIAKDKVIALYGGNFGKPQGIGFIYTVLDKYKDNEKVVFIFSGKGTEKKKLYNYIEKNNIKNAITLDFIPKQEYNNILKEADIGLIFLDNRFTIPNIPSRTLSYFEYSIPIIAATDKNTDYKEILKEAKAGLWSESNNIDNFEKNLNYLIENTEIRKKMGNNGRKYLEANFNVKRSIEILEKSYSNFKKEGLKNV